MGEKREERQMTNKEQQESQERLTVGVIQLSSGTDKTKNIQMALRLSQEAIEQGAQFILLPEVFNFRSSSLEMKDASEPIPGPSLEPLMALAKQHQVSILAGSIIEEGGDEHYYNSSALISSDGELSSVYRKVHLFDVAVGETPILESKTFSKGSAPVVSAVDGHSIGLSICYDVRFPELYRCYAREQVSMMAVPSSFTYPTGEAHWELLLRARAVENQCFILAPNQIGTGAGDIQSYGNSMIIDPFGKVLKRASSTEETVLIETLDFRSQQDLRTTFPCLSHMNLTTLDISMT